jgi:hypothetical protein
MAVNLFDANFYRAANLDLAALDDGQLKSHFFKHGLNEGRRFNPLVDLSYYRASNADLVVAGLDKRQIYDHLSNYGVQEGRKFSLLYDRDFYRNNNGDLSVLKNNEELFEHLLKYGVQEGRRFSPFVNLSLYKAANPDLNAINFDNKSLLGHLVSYGLNEGRRFSASFDINYYRNTYLDLEKAGFKNGNQLLEHFQNYGLKEGRISSESFSISYYLEKNEDLKKLGFNNQQALEHFELYGFKEDRLSVPSNSISPPKERDDNTLSKAFNFGVLNGTRNFTNQFVGTNDRDDYYRFTLTDTRNLNLSLTGLSDYTYVELIYDTSGNGQYDDRNEQMYSGYSYNKKSASLNITLGAGSYYIRVYTNSPENNTNYTLGVLASPAIATITIDPGNDLGKALDIGTVSTSNRSFTDFVGATDNDDYYRFNLTQVSDFSLSLTGLTDDAGVELIYDANGNGQYDEGYEQIDSSNSYNSRNASIHTTLGAGSYFLKVYTNSVSNNTNYTLAVSANTIQTLPIDPGSSSLTAFDIGIVGGNARTFKDFVGATDSNDWYRFSLPNSGKFSLNLTGLSDYAYVQLISYNNRAELGSTYGYTSRGGSIIKTLGAGSYLIGVYSDELSDNTAYTLTLLA